MAEDENKQNIPEKRPPEPPVRKREDYSEDWQRKKGTYDKFPSRVQPVDEWPDPDKGKKKK